MGWTDPDAAPVQGQADHSTNGQQHLRGLHTDRIRQNRRRWSPQDSASRFRRAQGVGAQRVGLDARPSPRSASSPRAGPPPSPCSARVPGLESKKRGIPVAVATARRPNPSPTSASAVHEKTPRIPRRARVHENWLLSPKVLAYRASRCGQLAMNKKVELTGRGRRAPAARLRDGQARGHRLRRRARPPARVERALREGYSTRQVMRHRIAGRS